MISYIRGEFVAVENDQIVVDVNGVGWGIYMPEQTMGRLPSIGEEVKIHTYLNVREDAMQLYGFCTRDDLEIFKLVIGVSGIGPKGGLNILSSLSLGSRFSFVFKVKSRLSTLKSKNSLLNSLTK